MSAALNSIAKEPPNDGTAANNSNNGGYPHHPPPQDYYDYYPPPGGRYPDDRYDRRTGPPVFEEERLYRRQSSSSRRRDDYWSSSRHRRRRSSSNSRRRRRSRSSRRDRSSSRSRRSRKRDDDSRLYDSDSDYPKKSRTSPRRSKQRYEEDDNDNNSKDDHSVESAERGGKPETIDATANEEIAKEKNTVEDTTRSSKRRRSTKSEGGDHHHHHHRRRSSRGDDRSKRHRRRSSRSPSWDRRRDERRRGDDDKDESSRRRRSSSGGRHHHHHHRHSYRSDDSSVSRGSPRRSSRRDSYRSSKKSEKRRKEAPSPENTHAVSEKKKRNKESSRKRRRRSSHGGGKKAADPKKALAAVGYTEKTYDDAVATKSEVDQFSSNSSAVQVSPDKRKFTVNGQINTAARGNHFVVPTTETNLELYQRIGNGEYVMLHGPRAVGKSTRMVQACDDLKTQYHCLNVDITLADRGANLDSFWSSFSDILQGKAIAATLGLRRFSSGPEFSQIWNPNNNSTLKRDKKYVLFIDEFDTLGDMKEEARSAILSIFRGLKNSAPDHMLHSVVIVGVFSMIRLNTVGKISPFNVGDAVSAPLLTEEEVQDMFKEYLACRPRFHVESEVIVDIHRRAGGHAGLVNMCGKAIDEEIRIHLLAESDSTGADRQLKLAVWLEWVRQRLFSWLNDFPTMRRMQLDLTGDDELRKAARIALSRQFLSSTTSVSSDTIDPEALDYLKTIGMVRDASRPNQVVIASSMVRSLAISKIVIQDCRQVVIHPLPMTEDGNLNMMKLLLNSTAYFPLNDLAEAVRWSYKLAGRGARRPVPSEYFYQSHLASIVRAWIPKVWRFFPEVRMDGNRQRIDFVLEDATPDGACVERRYVLELEATSSDTELREHYKRAKRYGELIGAGHIWVVHYSAENLSIHGLPTPPDGVHVLHLVHDKERWSAFYYCGAHENSTRQLELDVPNCGS